MIQTAPPLAAPTMMSATQTGGGHGIASAATSSPTPTSGSDITTTAARPPHGFAPARPRAAIHEIRPKQMSSHSRSQ